MTIVEAVKEPIWSQGLVSNFGLAQDKTSMFCDNQSVIHLSKNKMFHEHTKHIEFKHCLDSIDVCNIE